jgi:hypothetical protein
MIKSLTLSYFFECVLILFAIHYSLFIINDTFATDESSHSRFRTSAQGRSGSI